jgi:hypothetical protein
MLAFSTEAPFRAPVFVNRMTSGETGAVVLLGEFHSWSAPNHPVTNGARQVREAERASLEKVTLCEDYGLSNCRLPDFPPQLFVGLGPGIGS